MWQKNGDIEIDILLSNQIIAIIFLYDILINSQKSSSRRLVHNIFKFALEKVCYVKVYIKILSS